MKVTYWKINSTQGYECYAIRAKTKKECLAILEKSDKNDFEGSPHKVTVEYLDAFDLIQQTTGTEGGLCE